MGTLHLPASASREEAAAIVAALQRFLHDTAPPPLPAITPTVTAWQRAALAEGVARQPDLIR